MKIFNLFFPVLGWLYIFQLLDYDRNRFIFWITRHWSKRKLERKNRLKFTPKVCILLFLSIFLFLAYVFYPSYNLLLSSLDDLLKLSMLVLFILLNLQIFFIFIWLASFALSPLEKIVLLIYIQKARTKLSRFKQLKIIGITGSYGKTSTKEILAQILATEFKVLKTPENYNTPLGIAKTILNQLNADHQIFIVELAAHKKGDIRYLCDLVKPQIGILTGITEQHLERFGSLQKIAETKSELAYSLPKNGLMLINLDDSHLRQIKFKVESEIRGYSLKNKSDFQALNLEVGERGSAFAVSPGGEVMRFTTHLLGSHNVLNCLPALYLGLALGISFRKLASALSAIKPLPHRLQIIDSSPNVTVIDDAYSSNPQGFKAALEVLRNFSGKRKILITPGMVELGDQEQKIHGEVGRLAGQICDLIVLVGKNRRTRAFKEGLQHSNFDLLNLREAISLDDAQKILPHITKKDDVILFENDLPDQY